MWSEDLRQTLRLTGILCCLAAALAGGWAHSLPWALGLLLVGLVLLAVSW